ncbi:MAG: DUF1559 domain-containing protein [Isosphaeraceae bacterium]
MHNYHDTHGAFPCGYLILPGGNALMGAPDPITRDAGPGWGWGSLILPYLEQKPLSDSLNFDVPCWLASNTTGAQASLSAYLCPSVSVSTKAYDVLDESGRKLARFSRSHYAANSGRQEAWGYTADDWTNLADGPIYRNSRTSMATVRDGLSNTIFAGEHSAVLSDKTWVGAVPGAIGCPTPRFAFSFCDVAATQLLVHSGPNPWEDPPLIHPPNSRMCKLCQMYAEHPDGCNVLMGDGSVRFARSQINQRVWMGLATVAGGEVISADSW